MATIIKPLGHGVYGITYLAEYEGRAVILKKSHIDPYDAKDPKSRYYASLAFDREVASKYPEYFMHIVSSETIDTSKEPNKSWRFEDEIKHFKSPVFQKKSMHKSKMHISMIMEPVLDGTLKDYYNSYVIPHISNNHVNNNHVNNIRKCIYSFLAQFFHIYYLMEKHGWYHADSKWKNIMYKTVPFDTVLEINIDNNIYKIPTYGKKWYLIDYDPMYSEKFYECKLPNIPSVVQIANSKHFHLSRILEFLLVQPFWSSIERYNVKIARPTQIAEKIFKSRKASYIKDLLPILNETRVIETQTIEECAMGLCIMLEPEEYFNIIGLNGKLWYNDFIITRDRQYIDKEDYKFIIANLYDINKLIAYLCNAKDNTPTLPSSQLEASRFDERTCA